ncbi:selenocysteine lyase [Desulfoscipio gibsoniae DSM 7213]|uniref:Selenocysteine lyase n=1 Tax=Desulfoscipio gibsoniae DSM 7213 TaxID=767817 RepID=R4KF80_9FIRM|nr:selenocysteine lyase [Desulfoscipio gibsoniae DSM 7213]
MQYNISQPDLRNLVVGVDTKVPLANNTYVTAVNFDNAASTPPFFSVMKEINNFAPWYSSVHRGAGYKSIVSTQVYEDGRQVIKDFVKVDKEKDVVIYTRNTTESINMLAYLLCENDKNQVILSTWMEHLANDLPWRGKFTVDYVEIDDYGRLRLDDLENKLKKYSGRVKLVTVTGASNITGYVNPIHEIAKIVHKHGTKVLIDGAQLVPHIGVDMKPFGSPEHIDYLVFSSHKMYSPFGVGVLIGPQEVFANSEPVYKGGGDVKLVTHQSIYWEEPPARDEAGTPNVMGVAALTAAIKTMQSIGIERIEAYENALTNYALNRLKYLPHIDIYAYSQINKRKVSIIPFNIRGVHHELTAKILSGEDGIEVRNGLFCAHPYALRLLNLTSEHIDYFVNNPDIPFPGLVRVSFGLYNNSLEVDRFITALQKIIADKSYYIMKYSDGR